MDTHSPELQEVIDVIRREHRRTQLIFGVSIIILAVILMLTAPGIINMESDKADQGGNFIDNPGSAVPKNHAASSSMPAASSTRAATSTAS